jgi:hypothetical protein
MLSPYENEKMLDSGGGAFLEVDPGAKERSDKLKEVTGCADPELLTGML